tara:strand:+ start:5226 stop:6317 length:1092 start_codon:yes stop_codon:yes gene_type:complete
MSWRYTVGDKIILHKAHAIQESIKTNHPIHFHAPEEYDTFDASVEPEESLDDLLIAEARYLREKYKYLKLNYSGGLDSNLILKIFTDNDIKIDEIQCFKSGIPPADFEIDNFAIPMIKDLSHKLKHTKISIIEPTLDDYEKYYSEPLTDEKVDKGCIDWHLHCRIIFQKYLLDRELDPDVITITGKEKPRIIKHHDDYYTYFLDGDIEYQPQFYNFFVDNPKINAKQTHGWLKEFKKYDKNIDATWEVEYLWNQTTGRPVSEPFPKKNLHLNKKDNSIFHKGSKIYFQNEKERLAFDWLSKNAPTILDQYQKFIEALLDFTNNTWFNHGRPELMYVANFSKFYGLTKKDIKTVDELYPNGFKP